jgi:SAM-dependent methyltransferase
MTLGYKLRATHSMINHPRQGLERIRGRRDRRRDLQQLTRLTPTISELYETVAYWPPHLHEALGQPWPCQDADDFEQFWARTISELRTVGMRVGMLSYGGWNDGDRAFAEAIWCVVAHLRPERVVETGVAHGLTSRIILEGLERNGKGRLWSIDLPAIDSNLHPQIGVAVPHHLRSRWTYLSGTSRDQLPPLLAELEEIDVFVHDSLHTGRNQRFELESAWAHMRRGGAVVVDDVDQSLAFRTFLDQACSRGWMAAKHITGGGLWGVSVKSDNPPGPPPRRSTSRSERNQTTAQVDVQNRAWGARGVPAREPRGRRHALAPWVEGPTTGESRPTVIEAAVIGQIAQAIRTLALEDVRLLEVDARHGRDTLRYRDQTFRPGRPMIYAEQDLRDPAARAETDIVVVDLEEARFPAPDDFFDIVVWSRGLVRLKNPVPALQEVRRVLRPGGIFVVAVPNLAALQNRLQLLVGRIPTTHADNGQHVGSFTCRSMRRLLEQGLGFSVQQFVGVGLAPLPLTGYGVPPSALRGLSDTIVWVLRKPGAVG